MPDVTGTRANGANIFKFEVSEGDKTLAALLDVPRLYSTGNEIGNSLSACLANWEEYLDTFVVTGFPCTKSKRLHVPQIVGGHPGTEGAVYEWSFPVGGRLRVGQKISVRTEIVKVVDEGEIKEISFRHHNEGEDVPTLGCGIFVTPEILLPETETTFQIQRIEAETWQVTMSYKGVSGSDPTARQGCANYWLAIGVFSPLLLPVLPCVVYSDFRILRSSVYAQLLRVREYCVSYSDEEVDGAFDAGFVPKEVGAFQRTSEKSARNNDDTIVVVQAQRAAAEPQEVERWYQLYKNGAISFAEYQAQKGKLLHDS